MRRRPSFSFWSLWISFRYAISVFPEFQTSLESHLYTVTGETPNSLAASATGRPSFFTCFNIVSFTDSGITRKLDGIVFSVMRVFVRGRYEDSRISEPAKFENRSPE